MLKHSQKLAPALQKQAAALEKNVKRDAVKHSLSERPSVEAVAAKGIHPGTKVSSKLQGVAHDLEVNMHKDAVHHGLESRPPVEELEKHGIVRDLKTAQSLQPVAATVSRCRCFMKELN